MGAMAESILIDCDPGHDDALALLMALARPDVFDVLGITTVAGNIDVEQAERNARTIRDLAGTATIPVRAGCARPLVLPFRDASDFHGATGMDGFTLPMAVGGAHPQHAVDFIIDLLRGAASPVTLACLAPLTNIAVALVKAPDITSKIGEIVVLGGARKAGGNVTPTATFNLFCDPHAAHVVFDSGCPLTVVSLDASAQVIAGRETVLALGTCRSTIATMAAGILDFFNRRRIEVYGYGEDQTSLNDPCVIAYLLDRSLFAGQNANIAIEHRSDLTMGMTIVDLLGRTGRSPNALWLDMVNARGVLDTIVRTLTA
jgi:purine nucleosidase